MSTTINDIAKLLKSDDKKGDTSFWGIVHSTIEDGEGNVTGYNVSLDGSANGAVKCNKVVGAKQGDQVLVTLRANGEAVVVATKGGDTDAKDAQTTANQASQTASTASQTANTAYQMAQSVENHFWYDSDGAHIALAKPIQSTTLNTLINSGGMAIRSGTTELAKFTDSVVELGKNAVSSIIKLCGGHLSIQSGTTNSSINYKLNSTGDFKQALVIQDYSSSSQRKTATIITSDANGSVNNPNMGVEAQQNTSYAWMEGERVDIYGNLYINDVAYSGGGVDYITTQSSSGNWKYRKWNSGKVEAWYKGTVSGGSTSSENNVHRCTYTLSIPSGIFSSAPTVLVSVRDQPTKVFSITGEATSATSMRGAIFRANSDSGSTTYYISVYAWS